jgi:hypothetical protein
MPPFILLMPVMSAEQDRQIIDLVVAGQIVH